MIKTKKVRIRALSFILILTLLCSALLSGVVFAVPPTSTNGSPAEVTASNGKIHLNKSAAAVAGADRTYQMNLSVSSDSNVVVTTVPCDFVLVLDESGSMSDMIPAKYQYTPVSGTPSTSQNYYINIDGTYRRVRYASTNAISWVFGDLHWLYGGFGIDNVLLLWSTKVEYQHGGDGTGGRYEFYTRTQVSGEVSKMQALQDAATSFVTKIGENSADSRVAVIPYSSTVKGATGFVQTNASGVSSINNMINHDLYPDGATRADLGMQRAVNLFANDTPPAGTRQKVVVMFTDGEPTSGNEFENSVANATITAAKTIKQTYQAKVYTVGVFDGNVGNMDKVDEYMNKVSSNYSSLSLMGDQKTQPDGTGFYLESDDADQLANIFQHIVSETGETLQAAVVRDYIDPRFELVAGSATTGAVLGSDANGSYVQWTKTISPGTGNGFTGSFKVRAKDGYIGGNNIPTNGAQSALLTAGGSVVANFPEPTVDVPLRYNVASMADTVYVGDGVNLSSLYVQPSAFAKQDVNIATNWTAGASVTPTQTTNYNLVVTVTPKNTGAVAVGRFNGSATITVLKPAITFTDTNVFLGDSTDLNQRAASVNWNKPAGFTKPEPLIQYDFADSSAVGSPASYSPDVTTAVTAVPYRIVNGVRFNLNSYTTYTNNPFMVNMVTGTLSVTKTVDAAAVRPDQKFIFTIQRYEDAAKTQLTDTFYLTLSANQTKQVTNLPKGTYVVTEQADWSWRYTVQGTGAVEQTIDSANAAPHVEFVNQLTNPNWLDDQDSVTNSFDLQSH